MARVMSQSKLLLLFIPIAFCQPSVFVTVNETPTIASDVLKNYTTTVSVAQNETNFNSTAFQSAVDNYYGAIFQGFSKSVVITPANNDSVNGTFNITYCVEYNYVSLRNSTNDSDIYAKIGPDGVPNIFEGSEFELYNFTSNSTVVFTGNDICSDDGVSCATYATCTSNQVGVSSSCQSICVNQIVCYNKGLCIHSNGSQEPVCSCPSTTNDWYVGSNCKTHLHIWMPVVYFVVAFLLFIFVIVLTCWCISRIDDRLEKERRKSLQKEARENYDKPSKNQKVFVTIKSALGIKPDSKKTAKETTLAASPPGQPSDPQEGTVSNAVETPASDPPVPAPRLTSLSGVSQESSHEPTSSSSSEFGYATVQRDTQVPRQADMTSSISSSSGDERNDNYPSPTTQAEPVYTSVNKRKSPPQQLESTV